MPSPPFQRRAGLRAPVAGSLALVLCLFAQPNFARPQTPPVSPTRAVVFIRVIGDLELIRPPDATGGERRLQTTDVELSTGSGMLISGAGYVLTAAHVVTAERGQVTRDGVRVEIAQTVRRIEVLLPGDEGAVEVPAPLEASVLATDADLDLAVLTTNGANLPFLDLGDSDALAVGDAVEAVGFPFGEEVEIGRPRSALSAAPAASVSRGNVAAFRQDAQGERRYLQVTAALNAGNSGGPVVDADGYVVAIASSVLRTRGGGTTGVGFGVTVNVAKRFLESHGVDGMLRARRVVAGAPSPLEGKGLRVPLLVGTADGSPMRARVDAGSASPDGIALRIDRVLSAWTAARVAEALVSGRTFESFSPSSSAGPRAAEGSGGRVLLGRATGAADDGTAARMEYVVIDAGAEKVVARFVGPPHQVAYNASVLRTALRQIEAVPLRAASRALRGPLTWGAVTAGRGTPIDSVRVPAGWTLEPAGPFACRGVPPPSDVVGASPAADFAVALRAGWLPGARVSAHEAAAACGTPAAEDASAYEKEFAFLGTRYRLHGRFVAVGGDGLLQYESVTPADQAETVRAVFGEWVGK